MDVLMSVLLGRITGLVGQYKVPYLAFVRSVNVSRTCITVRDSNYLLKGSWLLKEDGRYRFHCRGKRCVESCACLAQCRLICETHVSHVLL